MTVENGTILKVVLDYVYPGAGVALNIFHYVYSGSTQSEEDITSAFVAWLEDDFAPGWSEMASASAEIETIAIQEVTGSGEVVRDIGSEVVNIPGDSMASVLPAANAAWMTAFTDVPQVRGSKFLPGLAEDSVDDGILDVSAVVSLALVLVAYLKRINLGVGDNLDSGVISKRLSSFKQFDNIGSFTPVVAYQRRRKPGVGS